jgi:hypothetical protein
MGYLCEGPNLTFFAIISIYFNLGVARKFSLRIIRLPCSDAESEAAAL